MISQTLTPYQGVTRLVPCVRTLLWTTGPSSCSQLGFESVLRRIGALPEGGLVTGEGWAAPSVEHVVVAFDSWFAALDLPDDPRQAECGEVSLCTYERWFGAAPAYHGCGVGDWSVVPDYVSHTAGIPAGHVRSLAAFRLGAHHLAVATGRWARRPRSDRVC